MLVKQNKLNAKCVLLARLLLVQKVHPVNRVVLVHMELVAKIVQSGGIDQQVTMI